jgi:hypothetical protein
VNAPEASLPHDGEHEAVLRAALASYLLCETNQRDERWAHFVALHAARSNAVVMAMESEMGLR